MTAHEHQVQIVICPSSSSSSPWGLLCSPADHCHARMLRSPREQNVRLNDRNGAKAQSEKRLTARLFQQKDGAGFEWTAPRFWGRRNTHRGVMALVAVSLFVITLTCANLHLARANNRHAVHWNSSNIQ
ncbi:ephrin-A3-like [Arapaima gigas]